MKCSNTGCPGVLKRGDVVHTVRQGERILVIDHVPAEVCDVCGDVLFTPETVCRIEALRHGTATPVRTVPLYDFGQKVPA